MSSDKTRKDDLKVRAAYVRPAPPRRKFLRRLWFPAVILLALAAGGLTGIVLAYSLNYSRAAEEVKALATYRPSVVTRVYADDGETLIGSFALERRIPLKFEEIPGNVQKSILAVEDARFFEHNGIDPIRIVGAVWKNVTTGSREGGSTLTQQLAKRLFLTPEQTYARKVNEWVVALQIERYYTKRQIMEMYVNNVFLGAGSYGFEAAAETYFGKQAKDLTVEEAALLAGIPKAPSQLSPTVNMEGAKERRNLVLQLMANNDFISQADADAAKSRPIKLHESAYAPSLQSASPVFAYPVEEIRQQLEDKYTTRVAQGGLTVYSTVNAAAQKEAYYALREGLRVYDRGHSGWRSAFQPIAQPAADGTVPVTQQQLASYHHTDWYEERFKPGEYLMGLITKVDIARNEATAHFGSYDAVVTAKDMGRATGRQPRQEFKVGYLAEFKIKDVNADARKLTVELSQTPAVEGAMMTINAKNGEIVTMVGGYDFNRNKFNNATQAYRQTGSCFKPYVYTAAVEWGMTPDTVLSGAPLNKGGWTPHNYDGSTSCGDVPMKTALARSLNIPAVHALDMVGIQTGAQMVRRFGITVPMAPYLPSALGATEVPLVEMVSAYSTFPNKGVRHEKHLIRRVLDRDGNTLEEWERTTFKVVSEYVALTMVQMMRGVTSGGGTAPGASAVGVPVAGKTGTVNDHTDVWFIGYTPTYVTGVWMGYPGFKKNLGSDMTGGHGALPIWVDFMKDFLKDKPKEKFEDAPKMPEDIKELYLQRQHEMREEQANFLNAASKGLSTGDKATPAGDSADSTLEKVTLPPPPGEGLNASTPADSGDKKSEPAAPRVNTHDDPAPPPPATRPREVESNKKKGKKGNDDQ
ncbi:MAG TPA: PBP1A family penicillin-binding protein [Pyrinomonadaceae bacterium]|nr:PBP1A family penicillin-binding protein [Pyrinomonadaceae bacterium]